MAMLALRPIAMWFFKPICLRSPLGHIMYKKCHKFIKMPGMAMRDPSILTYPSRLSTGKDGVSFFHEGLQTLGAILRCLGQGKLVHVSVAGSGV